jgi:translation initiation factor 2D
LQVKPLSPLNSSDRRRTADQIIADFSIDVPVDTNADSEDKAASTAGLTALRKSLLPENALSARFTTTAGPDLKQVSGTVYVGSHESTSGEQRILWVKLFDKMYPTVYTLWHNPRIVPLLYTPLVVVEKMQAGADLMTPGLQRGPPFPEKATKGAVVAIASLEAPTVPMAVGTCEIDVSALDKVQGMKGIAVSTFHWAGDELWSWNPTGKPGIDPPDIIPGWDDEQEEETSLAERTAAVDLDDQEGGVTLDEIPTERSEAEKAQSVEGEAAPSNHDFIDVIDDKELTTKGMIQGALVHSKTNKAQKSTMPSRTHFCTVYVTTWSIIGGSPITVSTSPFRNRSSCRS